MAKPCVIKMAQGFAILGVSYLLLAAVQWQAGPDKVHWLWSAVFFAVYTVGELYFMPVGLPVARQFPGGLAWDFLFDHDPRSILSLDCRSRPGAGTRGLGL